MVNYQGPEFLRGLVEAVNIPIFNRVTQINFTYRDLRDIPLSKEDVIGLHELEQISVSKTISDLTASDMKTAKDLVPPCRLAAMDDTTSQIKIEVNPGYAFACSSK